jgi:biotin carboxylase
MKTALVLGANAGQADLIRHLKDTGWRVCVCAGREGEPGARIADRFFHVDITDIVALPRIVQEEKVDLVYSISSDIGIRSATKLAEVTGRPHFYDSDFIDLLDDKAALRGFLAKAGLDAVRFMRVESEKEASGWGGYPCVVKPLDAQGQRGVVRLETPEGLDEALEKAITLSPSGQAIVEELLEGVEISCNVLTVGGEIRILQVSERLVHTDIGFGIPKGHLIPTVNVTKEHVAEAERKVEAIVKALGMRDGPLYFQMIVTAAGPRIIEIAPRLDGCHMWRLIRAATGVDLLAAVVDALAGETPEVSAPQSHEAVMELMFQQTGPGIVFRKADFLAPDDFLHHEYRYEDGAEVLPINGACEVVGYYVRTSTELSSNDA